jgi:hypothetical protein
MVLFVEPSGFGVPFTYFEEHLVAGGKIQLYIPDDARNKIMGGRAEMSKLAKPIDLK